MKADASVLATSLGLCLLTSSALVAQDFNESATFGNITLSSGFSPDPHVQDLIAGGNISARERFSNCRGYIAHAPDFSVNYTAGSFPLIFSVDSDTDTTLVINGPDARWHCDDDGAEEPLNPLIRFNNPQSGRYDVWVGTYSSNSNAEATLFVSELGEHTRETARGGSGYASSQLNISAAARFADITLNGGFLPDPYQLRLTAGGSVSVNDANLNASGSCRGYVTSEPSVELDYNGNGEVHIYTNGDVDTTLVVNAPDGSWHCSDDEIGTDAGLSFYSGTEGVYDIYVGTYSQGDRPTTLMISEISLGYMPNRK